MAPFSTQPSSRLSLAEQNEAIHAIAGAQAGLIAYRQLRDVGLSSKSVRGRVRTGSLIPRSKRRSPRPGRPTAGAAAGARESGQTREAGRPEKTPRDYLHTGAYSTHAGRLTLDGLRWAAVLCGPEDALLGDVSALVAAGLSPQRGHAMHVLRLGERWDAPKGVIPHRTSWLPAADRVIRDGIPSTSVARALVDAAVHLEPRILDDILDTAVRRGEYDGRGILRVVEGRPTFPGTPRLVAAVGRLDATSGTFRSLFERRTKRLMETSDVLPPAAVNVVVEGFENDLWIPGTRAIIECDGRDYHRSPAQVARDEERERILRARGYVILRLRWHHVVYEEERTLRRIERFVLANLAAPVPAAR